MTGLRLRGWKFLVLLEQAGRFHRGVDLRRADARVAHHLLDRPQVGAAAEQVRGRTNGAAGGGFTDFMMPARLALFFTITQSVFREIAFPRSLRKSSLPVRGFKSRGRAEIR